MNMVFLDADTQEVIAVIEDPAPATYDIGAERFAAGLGAAIERITFSQVEDEYVIELNIPPEVRQVHMPLPGERVIFTARAGYYEEEMPGTYQFKRGRGYVICDDVGGEWLVRSMWQMKRLSRDRQAG
jgi:hypothetical protein